MNDRIAELAEQAAEFADANEFAAIERRIWNNIFRNKFAELIIRECIQEVEKTRELVWTVPLKDDEQITASVCAIKLKFGVE